MVVGNSEREITNRARRGDSGHLADQGLLFGADATGLHDEGVGESNPLAEVVDDGEPIAPRGDEHGEADHQRASGQPKPERATAKIAGDQRTGKSPEGCQSRTEKAGDDHKHRNGQKEVAEMKGGEPDKGVERESQLGVRNGQENELKADQRQAGAPAGDDRE